MKNKLNLITISFVILLVCSCASTTTKMTAYKGFYDEKPVAVLIMPPVNNTQNVDAKDYFYSTLNVPICNNGYYVFPPFLTLETLQHESAYDSEMFINNNISKFNMLFGADIVVFTIIKKWKKSMIGSKVTVEIEYIIKSAKTNSVIYDRNATLTCDTSVDTGLGSFNPLLGLIANATASAVNTAVTEYTDVARSCNNFVLSDMPAGKYTGRQGQDGELPAGDKNISETISK